MRWGLLIVLLSIFAMLHVAEECVGQQRHPLIGHAPLAHGGNVKCCGFTADSKYLVSGDHSGSVIVWDTQRCAPAVRFELDGQISHMRLSPDGRTVAIATEAGNPRQASLRLIELKQQGRQVMLKPLTAGATRAVRDIEFSPDGSSIATLALDRFGSATELKIWNASTGEPLDVVDDEHALLDVSFSADAKMLAGAGRFSSRQNKGCLLLWNVRDWPHPRSISIEGLPTNIEFSMDGQLAATPVRVEQRSGGATGDIRLFQVETGKELGRMGGLLGSIAPLAFSPQAPLLVASACGSGAWGEVPGETVQLWNLSSGRQMVLERNTHAHDVAFFPDGRLATAFAVPSAGVKIWDLRTGQVISTLQQGRPRSVIMSVDISPDGTMLATTSVYNVGPPEEVESLLLSLWKL
jgi:WD40 repeat protein